METILIQNFKAIKNTAKREIKVANLTILMGEQATGKSTVAKLVYFFKKLPEQIIELIFNGPDLDLDNFDDEIAKSIHILFRHLFGSSDSLKGFVITYKYINELKIEISKSSNEVNYNITWSKSINDLKEMSLKLKQEYNYVPLGDFKRMRLRQQQFLDKTIFLVNSFFGYNQYSVYVPASRNAIVTLEHYLIKMLPELEIEARINGKYYASENYYLLIEFIYFIENIKNKFRGGGFEKIIKEKNLTEYSIINLDEILDKFQKILAGKYSFDKDNEKLINTDESTVNLVNASSGQQEAIRIIQDIFLEVLENRPVFRVYEEPESHLSPVGQLGVIQLIAMLANRNPDNQIIIPTHTPYLLYEINNMLEASKIVKDHPELSDEVSKILKPFYWLDIENVSAYQLNRDGEIEDARDLEYQMVDGMLFDKVTNDTSSKFEELLRLQHEA